MSAQMPTTVLILPGLFNSGEGHWQTLWESALPNARRVRQDNWNAPERRHWVAALDAVIAVSPNPVVFAAHSLGCVLAAWWAREHAGQPHASKVKGALLVAPPDVERKDFPDFVTGFAPMPLDRLPFPNIVVASSDDPWCEPSRARAWAENWGSIFHDIGAHGHINAESGLSDWPAGREWLHGLSQ